MEARLSAAGSLREVGAIRSDAVERAFATVLRHRCVPRFRHGAETIVVPVDEPPCDEVLDIVYSHRSLVTSTGFLATRDGRITRAYTEDDSVDPAKAPAPCTSPAWGPPGSRPTAALPP